MNRNTLHFHLRTVIKNGFSLLEVLVALVLFSFILMMIYGNLYAGGRSWRASEIQARENDDKRLILSFIRRQVGEAMPMIQVDKQEERVMFHGNDSSLEFVSRLPAHHAGSGIYFLKLAMRQDELVLNYLPLARDKALFEEDIFVETEAISLLKNIKALDLDYFGRDSTEAEPAWYDGWDNKERLPELMRFQVVADRHDPWPALLIALRSQAVRGQPQLTLHREEEDGEG